MTIFLIVLIIFLGVWINDSANKKKKSDDYKESTKTDVKTECSLYAKWVDIIDAELKEKVPKWSDWSDTSWTNYEEWSTETWTPISVLDYLYEKYDIPFIKFNESIYKDKIDRDKKALYEMKTIIEAYFHSKQKAENWKNKQVEIYEEWEKWIPPTKREMIKESAYRKHNGTSTENWTWVYKFDRNFLKKHPLIDRYISRRNKRFFNYNEKERRTKEILESSDIKTLVCPFAYETYKKLKLSSTNPIILAQRFSPDIFWEDKDIAIEYTLDQFETSYEIVAREACATQEECRRKGTKEEYWASLWRKNQERIKNENRNGNFRCWITPEFDFSTYSFIMCNIYSRERYRRLIKYLVRRELAGYGYSPSPNIIKKEESAWQEREAKQKRFEDQQKRYPWL